MKKPLLLFLLFALAGIMSPKIVHAAPPTAPSDKEWTTHFSDEFSGSSIDTGTWQVYHNTYGDGNNELACLTPNNVSVSSGTLKITAKRETITCPSGASRNFTSGFLGTREKGNYFPRSGYYEIRAKIPHAQGLWPAFWLRHRNGASTAEVDVMEYFHSQVPGRTTSTLHLDSTSNVSKNTLFVETPTDSPGWHTWGVHIDQQTDGSVKFTFYLNGVAHHTYTDAQANWSKNYSQDDLFDMAVNLAVGGNWVGRPDDALGYLQDINRCAQGGTPPNSCVSTGIVRAAFPEVYEVDYVRVYTLQAVTPSESGGGSSSSGGSGPSLEQKTNQPSSPANTSDSTDSNDSESESNNEDANPSEPDSQSEDSTTPESEVGSVPFPKAITANFGSKSKSSQALIIGIGVAGLAGVALIAYKKSAVVRGLLNRFLK